MKIHLKLLFVIVVLFICPLIIKGQSENVNTGKQMERPKSSGYTNITELVYEFGVGSSHEQSSFGIQMVNGYLFNPHISSGAGLGIDRLEFTHHSYITQLPLFLDLRFYFLNDPGILFFACDAGYVVNLTGYNQGYKDNLWGKFINPSFGFKFFAFPRTAININIGYKLQENTITYLNMALPSNEQFVTLRVGVVF